MASSLTRASWRKASIRSVRSRATWSAAAFRAASKRVSSFRACAIVCSIVASACRPEIMPPAMALPRQDRAAENRHGILHVEAPAPFLAQAVALNDAVVVLVAADLAVDGLVDPPRHLPTSASFLRLPRRPLPTHLPLRTSSLPPLGRPPRSPLSHLTPLRPS